MDNLNKIDLVASSLLMEALGTADLASCLLRFLEPYIDADTLQLYCFHRSISGEVVDIDYYGAAAKSADQLAKIDAGGRSYLYHAQAYRYGCPDMRRLKILKDGQAVWVTNPEDFAEPDLMAHYFGGGRFAQFCVYANAAAQHSFAFWLGRLSDSRAFSPGELEALSKLGQLFAPMLIKHAELAPVSLSLGHQASGLRQRLERKLVESKIELSPREQQVCLGILLGQQAPSMALRMGVAVTSITTYKKRAFAKIGVCTRQELFNWCFVSPD